MRSLLVVSDLTNRLPEAWDSGADALILDLEGRPAERAAAAAAVAATRARAPALKLYIRVNRLDSALIDADLDAVMPAAPDGIALPGSRGGADAQRLGAKLAVYEADRGLPDGATRIIAFATPSARALFGLSSYAGASPRLEGLAWEPEELRIGIGALTARLADGGYIGPLRLARDLALLAAVAAGASPIDAPFADLSDEAGWRAECLAARRDGFVAKIAIDAARVRVINEVFG